MVQAQAFVAHFSCELSSLKQQHDLFLWQLAFFFSVVGALPSQVLSKINHCVAYYVSSFCHQKFCIWMGLQHSHSTLCS